MPSSGVSKSSRGLAPEREQTSPGLGKKPGGTVILVGNQKTNTPKSKEQPWKKLPCSVRNCLRQISAVDLKVWLAYLCYSDAKDVAFPGREELVEMTGLYDDTISAARRRLVAAGWLKRGKTLPNNGRFSIRSYEVVIPHAVSQPARNKPGTATNRNGKPPADRAVYETVHRAVSQPALSRSSEVEPLEVDTAQASPSLSPFDSFWQAYPKKVAKPNALRAWKKIKPGEVPAILASIEWHKKGEDWAALGGQFIPYPATFLRNRRWEDEVREALYRKLAWSPSMEEEESDKA